MRPGAVIRICAALLLALSAHLALLHALRTPAPPVRIEGGAVSFEIGAVVAPDGGVDGGAESEVDPDAVPVPVPEPEQEQEPEPEPEPERAAPEPDSRPVEPTLRQAPARPDAAAGPDAGLDLASEPRPEQVVRAPVPEPGASDDAAANRSNRHAPDTPAARTEVGEASAEEAAGNGARAGAAERATEREQVSDQVGNAASANYAGEVMRHLSQVRRPRASGPGSAFISFTIAPSGDLESVQISRSSGSSRFDRDALRVVERAAPFPEPPPGVNSSFVVEIKGG